MAITLYELCGADRNCRFSPFVWRTRLALAHKGLSFKAVPANYHEKDQFADSGSKTYPVIRDGDKWVVDSWAIAEYLEEAYQDRPSLFGSVEGKEYARFMHQVFATTIQPTVFLLLAPDIHDILHEEDKGYFYSTRSERVGMPLDELLNFRDKNLGILKKTLNPIRETLKTRDFFSGSGPLYPDYIAFSIFKWAAVSSSLDLLEGEDDIRAWFDRVQGIYVGNIKGLEDAPLL